MVARLQVKPGVMPASAPEVELRCSRVLFIPALVLVCGCSGNPRPHAGQGLDYARADAEDCGVVKRGDGAIEVAATDELGQPIAGVHVLVTEATGPRDEGWFVGDASTDFGGKAQLVVPGGRYYTLLVTALGFRPEARIFFLGDRCSATFRVTLAVLQVEGVS